MPKQRTYQIHPPSTAFALKTNIFTTPSDRLTLLLLFRSLRQEPVRYEELEQRVMKARLDELRSTLHLNDDPQAAASSSIERDTNKLLLERFKR